MRGRLGLGGSWSDAPGSATGLAGRVTGSQLTRRVPGESPAGRFIKLNTKARKPYPSQAPSRTIPAHDCHNTHNRFTAGVLYGWGLDAGWRWGSLGGDTHYPRATLGHLSVIAAAASRHSLLVLSDGSVMSMGFNDSAGGGGGGSAAIADAGQLGRGGGQRPGRVRGGLEVRAALLQ